MDRSKEKLLMVLSMILIVALLVGGTYLLMVYLRPDPDTTVGELESGPEVLGEVEVDEYKGAELGSSDDFRENSILGPQFFNMETYRLEVTGLVDQEMSYSYDQILEGNALYRKVVTLNCVEGWSVKVLWDGVLVRDIISAAGPLDSAKVLIFKAKDGYTTSLPIEFFYDNDVLMAYGMNNVTLEPERGFPFQLVAEMKWGYKWIKWITEIELSDDIDYKGYWEERGFSNSADLDEPY